MIWYLLFCSVSRTPEESQHVIAACSWKQESALAQTMYLIAVEGRRPF